MVPGPPKVTSPGCLSSWQQTNLDGDGAAPFEDEVAALEVLVGGAAQLDVHLLGAMDTTPINHSVQTQTPHDATPVQSSPPRYSAAML